MATSPGAINSRGHQVNAVRLNGLGFYPATYNGASSFAGSGALNTGSYTFHTWYTNASYAGVGAFNANAIYYRSGRAAFSGAGVLSAAAIVRHNVVISLAGLGSVYGLSFPQAEGSLVGSGNLSTRAVLLVNAYQTQFWGSSSLVAEYELAYKFIAVGTMNTVATIVRRFLAHEGYANGLTVHTGGNSIVNHPGGTPPSSHDEGDATTVHPGSSGTLRHAA